MAERNSTFYPVKDLSDKRNFKRYSIIERNGDVINRILLDIPIPALREEIIFQHYLKMMTKNVYREVIGLNIISRDSPWDFKIELSNGDAFNLEITSIADNQWSFEKIKREEILSLAEDKKQIRIRDLKKISSFFPDMEFEKMINEYIQQGYSKNDLIDNPLKSGDKLFISHSGNTRHNLTELIKEALERKMNKNHEEKENTVLLLDNRTTVFETDDLFTAHEQLENDLKTAPFREIWFYTGYYSSIDSNDSEYSLYPLKITKGQRRALKKLHKKHPIKDRIIFT